MSIPAINSVTNNQYKKQPSFGVLRPVPESFIRELEHWGAKGIREEIIKITRELANNHSSDVFIARNDYGGFSWNVTNCKPEDTNFMPDGLVPREVEVMKTLNARNPINLDRVVEDGTDFPLYLYTTGNRTDEGLGWVAANFRPDDVGSLKNVRRICFLAKDTVLMLKYARDLAIGNFKRGLLPTAAPSKAPERFLVSA